MNYYELFNIPVSPKVDMSVLQKKYYELQRAAHPDFHSGASEEEKQTLLELSAHINKAIVIFKDEQKSIAYFLELKGVLETDDKYALPNDFLMEMMELNEVLEDNNRESVVSAIQAIETHLAGSINGLLQKNDAEFTEEALNRLKGYYYKKKYLQRILDRLHE